MAKKKPDLPEDDEPRRVGDATEFDFSLKKQDEELAKAEGSDFDLLTPAAEDIVEIDGPRIGDATESTYNEIDLGEVPMASGSASSSNLFGTNVPAATPADSAANLEPIQPVQPASGWFDEAEPEAPKPVATDAIDAAMAQPASGIIDGSDIFAGPVPAALPKSDVSDVIAATAYGTAKPADGEKRKSSRASDVALNFDRPPGGSTIESLAASADLPVAEEAPDSLFGEEADSSRFSKTPNLPSDAADLGATPPTSIDASSILADLSEPGSAPGDSSAIRLEAPGVDATLKPGSASGMGKFGRESTELDMDLPEATDADATDWRSQSGSDLFGTKPEFELTPDMGKVDPFGDELDVDQPSLSSAPSSIFSGSRPPAGGSGSSVPVANPDSKDEAVEFSDHPDPNSADSGSFHVLPAGAGGAVDFDMPESNVPHPERTMMGAIPEDEDDWTNAKTDPSESGILSKRKDPTDEMAPVPATPVKGRPDKAADKPKVVGWADDPEEEEKATPRRKEPKAASGGGGRSIAALALGLLIGVGASAGVYLGGVVPNETKGDAKTVTQGDPEVQAKLDAATNSLKTKDAEIDEAKRAASDAKLKLALVEDDIKTAKMDAAKFMKERDAFAGELKVEQGKTLQAIKDGAADKEKVVTLGKDLTAEKEKTVKAEKDLTAEKEKVVKAEKDLVTEKDKLAKADKDYKEMLVKVTDDAKKQVDTAKADVVKAMDLLKTEAKEKAKFADAVKAKQATVDAIAKELQAGKLLPEKFDDAALLAAAKSSVSRATGPDLSKLIPPELSSVAGTGLSTGHILDLAARTNKADAATKTAVAETAKLKTDHAAELKAMADSNKKAVTDLKDTYAADLKKAADANTVAMDKLKTELKTAKDGVAAEVKKATDAAAVTLEKQKADADAKLKVAADAHAKQVASLENAVLAEKARTAEVERRFQAFGGAGELVSKELDRVAAANAARNRDAGIAAFKAGRWAQAITALDEAAKHDPKDPLAWYFLGASKWAQGKLEDAKADFKKGAEREGQRQVPAREVDAMLAPIQGPARDALSAARP